MMVLFLMKLVNISDCELGVNDDLALATTFPGMIAGRIEKVQLYNYRYLFYLLFISLIQNKNYTIVLSLYCLPGKNSGSQSSLDSGCC